MKYLSNFKFSRKTAGILALVVSPLLMVSTQTQATTLTYLDSFGILDGDDATAIGVYAGSVYVGYEDSAVNSIVEKYTGGVLQSSVNINKGGLSGLSFLGSGNMLISSDVDEGGDGDLHEYTAAGAFVQTFAMDNTIPESTGVVVGDDGFFYVVQKGTDTLYKLNPDGSINASVAAGDKPEGVTYNGITESLFFVAEDGSSKSIFEISTGNNGSDPFGTLVEITDLEAALFAALGAGNYGDPEGITVDVANQILYVVFGDGDLVAAFQIEVAAVPLPGALIFFGSGLLSLFGFKRLRS